jgi:DNA-3-methyladenine glycosylase I
MGQEWKQPNWMHRDALPPDDSTYFEILVRCIFQAGLNWNMITKKWPGFKKAFVDFNIQKIAKFGEKDIERLLVNKNIVRNKRKIHATIENAKIFTRLAEEDGSFKAWFTSLDKSENYVNVVKELMKTFNHVGETTAHVFIYAVGEDIKHNR